MTAGGNVFGSVDTLGSRSLSPKARGSDCPCTFIPPPCTGVFYADATGPGCVGTSHFECAKILWRRGATPRDLPARVFTRATLPVVLVGKDCLTVSMKKRRYHHHRRRRSNNISEEEGREDATIVRGPSPLPLPTPRARGGPSPVAAARSTARARGRDAGRVRSISQPRCSASPPRRRRRSVPRTRHLPTTVLCFFCAASSARSSYEASPNHGALLRATTGRRSTRSQRSSQPSRCRLAVLRLKSSLLR